MKRELLLLIISLYPAAAQTRDKKIRHHSPPSQPAVTVSPKPLPASPLPERAAEPPTESKPQARTIAVGPKDLIAVRARINFSTMLILSPADSILEVTCGDKEAWVINGADNVVHIKPTREGTKTNLNVISRSGRYFSFLLTEISNEKASEPDLKLFIEPKEALFIVQRPVEVAHEAELANLRKELEAAKQRAEQAKVQNDAPRLLHFGYRFETIPPLNLSVVFDDGVFTYIRAAGSETPTLYEVKDGKQSLVQFNYRDGVHVVSKVLDEGCLVHGRKSACFSRKR